MKVQKLALACTAVAVAVSACGSSGGDEAVAAGVGPASPAVDYPDRMDLGDGFQLGLDLPDRAGIQLTGEGGLILMWEGRDLSVLSQDELTKLDRSGELTAAMNAGDVSMVVVGRDDCMGVDVVRNQAESVDTTSPLNGRDVTYRELRAKTLDDEGSVTANEISDAVSRMFWLKLGGSPCTALTMANVKMKTSATSPLSDLPYQVLVEGEGLLTGSR